MLGALLFAIYPWLAPPPSQGSVAGPAPSEIVVDAGRVQSLTDSWAEEWQRPPTPPELDGLIEEEVRSEILAREAVRQGLDRNDVAIRTLLREKMELIAEHAVTIAEPSPDELAAFYQSRKEEFGGGPTLSFSQVLLDPSGRGAALAGDAQAMLAQLRAGGDGLDPATLGDASSLASQYVDTSEMQVEAQLGPEFVRQLKTSAPGVWSGPIASAYGLHLVRLDARGEGALPPLAEVLDVVREEWRVAQAQGLRDADYRRLRERYRIVVERPAPATGLNGGGSGTAP